MKPYTPSRKGLKNYGGSGANDLPTKAGCNVADAGKRSKNGLRGALSLSLVQRLVSLVFSFGAITIISRLLTPSEVGVFSIAAGLVALVHMLRDFGVSEFVVQEKDLDETVIRSVFTLSLVIAWCLGCIVFLASGAVGRFYGDVGVTEVLRVQSVVFFLLPFGTTTTALLKRELEFGKLTRIHIGGSITRSCTAVALAYAGFSYMSMAWASVAAMSVTIIGCVLWGWRYRVTGLSLTHWKRVLRFGSNQTISDIVRQLGEQSANLASGRVLGMSAAGLFSRGYGVVNMYRSNIVEAIGSVAFPAFAREHREHAAAPELFLKALVYITGISWPFFSCGILLAYPIINILFGDQWNAAVPLMRWLCGAAVVGTLIYQCNHFLVALGRVGTVTRVEIQYQLFRIGITIAAAFYSLEAIAASQVLVYIVATILYYRKLQEYDTLAIRKCAKALVPSAVVTLLTCVVPAVVVFWPGFVVNHMVAAFAVALVGGSIGWFGGIALTRHPLLHELRAAASRSLDYYRRMHG